MDPWGVYLSRIFFEFFPKPVYSTMVVEKSQSYTVKIIAIHLSVKKMKLFFFNHAPSKNLPQVLIIILQAEGNCPFPLNSDEDIFTWGEKRIMELKELSKLTKVSVTSCHKFHTIFPTFTVLVFFSI